MLWRWERLKEDDRGSPETGTWEENDEEEDSDALEGEREWFETPA
jgi:hypothetical protein